MGAITGSFTVAVVLSCAAEPRPMVTQTSCAGTSVTRSSSPLYTSGLSTTSPALLAFTVSKKVKP